MKHALIIGCGYVGMRLAKNLVKKGIKVTGVRRDASLLPNGIAGLSHDVVASNKLSIPKDTDVVFYAVAAADSTESSYRKAYVVGLQNAIAACKEAHIKRFIFVSSTAVYHQDDGSWVDESSPTKPNEFNGKILLESEALVAASGLSSSTIRLGGIYGPGRTYFLDGVRSGRLGIIGKSHYTNRIHRDDCAGILEHIATLPNPKPLYLGVDDKPCNWDELIQFLARALDVTPKTVSHRPRSSSKRCSNKLLQESGYTFRYPTYREGYLEVLKSYL